jgi:flagellar biosynthesis protein FlhF
MRIRSFKAKSEAEALQIVRREMGPDAIIVSTTPVANGGFEVTAASETAPPPQVDFGNPVDVIGSALDEHATPRKLQDKIISLVERSERDDPLAALSWAFSQMFQFSPLPMDVGKPIMLVGVPGVGKTVTIAKLAARSVMLGKPAICISTDTQRAGAIEQLEAFTKILKIDLLRAKNPQSLSDALVAAGSKNAIFVDTGGINIWQDKDLAQLIEMVKILQTEPVFVYAAGGEPRDAAEIAKAFQALGAKQLLVTRLDITRRYGSILAAAEAGNFRLGDVSISAHVADGLSSLDADKLARIYLPSTPYNQ